MEERKKLYVLVADMAHLLLFELGVPHFLFALGPANPGSAAGRALQWRALQNYMAKGVDIGRGEELGPLRNFPHLAFNSLGNFLFHEDRREWRLSKCLDL